jgi:hypothetical protein
VYSREVALASKMKVNKPRNKDDKKNEYIILYERPIDNSGLKNGSKSNKGYS